MNSVIRRVIVSAVVVAAALGLAACSGGSEEKSSAPAVVDPSSVVADELTTVEPVAPAAAPIQAPEPEGVSFVMPSFVGMNLQDAQDRVQSELGVFYSTSHDVLDDRFQAWDRNWQVCDQTPPAGTTVTAADSAELEGSIDFGVVKNDESCP